METHKISLFPNQDLAENMELWMTNLPQRLRDISIIDLAIPGSHDSMTYGITYNSELAPDAEPILQILKFLGPILTTIMARWSIAQSVSATEQLKLGIRYFDLRIATKENEDQFYFVHGLYSVEVSAVLKEIKVFLDSHPHEVVILDCQHFYALTQSDHQRLIYILISIFGQKLLPYNVEALENISLDFITIKCQCQVIVVYRDEAARNGQPLLWPSGTFPTPWADTDSISELIAFLSQKLRERNPSVGFISQCVLTPSTWTIVLHLLSTLKNQCFLPLEQEKYLWLNNQMPGRGGINVVISDFVGYEDGKFPKTVVSLNQKLLNRDNYTYEYGDAITPVHRF